MLQILAATTNKHKIQEFQAMLNASADSGRVCIISPDTIKGFPEIVENGTTFEENARIKAGQAARYADMAAFADDSGLEVLALGGAPGIYSARYKGLETEHERRLAILNGLEGKANRNARFICCICLIDDTGARHLFKGIWNGMIAEEEAGFSFVGVW